MSQDPRRGGVQPTKKNICCTFLISATLGSIFGIYAFDNPDGPCYYKDGVAYVSAGKGRSDVAYEFYWFFLIGFLLMLMQIIYTTLGVIYMHTNNPLYARIAKILFAITSLTSILWLILGTIFRFKKSGQVCTEVLLDSSGKLIFVYLCIMYVVLSLFVCCGIIACIIIKPSRGNRAAV